MAGVTTLPSNPVTTRPAMTAAVAILRFLTCSRHVAEGAALVAATEAEVIARRYRRPRRMRQRNGLHMAHAELVWEDGRISMEIEHVRAFVALAQTKRFTTAAHALGVSQPTLSRHVQRLEVAAGA